MPVDETHISFVTLHMGAKQNDRLRLIVTEKPKFVPIHAFFTGVDNLSHTRFRLISRLSVSTTLACRDISFST